ncbi:hypothetical protein [Desulfuromonas sp.]|uniref:hypothetical protein n=1 Tax=Desulfuromonas sp. TaxID=892 RepID=UPI0025C6D75F|nr:hypothetical protein [Desulfuromonas sp.]
MGLHWEPVAERLYRDKPGLILVHIPKTGGSSVASAIRRHYRLSDLNIRAGQSSRAAEALTGMSGSDRGFDAAVQSLRASLAFYAAERGVKFITGHLWYEPAMKNLEGRGYHCVSVIREPVARWYSAYFYRRFKSAGHGKIDLDIEAFLDSEQGRSLGSSYVRYLGGTQAGKDYCSHRAVTVAIERMRGLAVIGCLEDLKGFQNAMSQRFGLRLEIPHKRKSPVLNNPEHLELMNKAKGSNELRKRIEEICAPNMVIYEHVRSRGLGTG